MVSQDMGNFSIFINELQGAKVYITGRRMEVLENAAKSHSPEGGGQILPYGELVS